MINAFEKVQALKKKHPDKNLGELVKIAKVTPSAYQYHARKVRNAAAERAPAPKKKAASYKRVVVKADDSPRVATDRQAAMIFGTPEQLGAILRGLQ